MDGKMNLEKTEALTAQSGEPILKWEGRLLASQMDPHQEAIRWVARVREQLASSERVIVLGFGCGYHLEELARQFSQLQILVLGFEEKVQEFAKSLCHRPQVEWFLCTDLSDLMGSPILRRYLAGSFELLEHPSILNLNLALYRELKERLLARDPLFFSEWVRRETRLSPLFPLRAIPGGNTKRLLSIKDLDRMVGTKTEADVFDVAAIRVLRELVR